MICVPESTIQAAAKKLPVAYLEDCRAVAQIQSDTGRWCFSPVDFFYIRKKYRGYTASEADTYREGEIISGCCDRADQY